MAYGVLSVLFGISGVLTAVLIVNGERLMGGYGRSLCHPFTLLPCGETAVKQLVGQFSTAAY